MPRIKQHPKLLAFDTESLGLDHWHGARAFFVTAVDDQNVQKFWGPETGWVVDPLTREVSFPPEDGKEIRDLILSADVLVGQNIRFDCHALSHLGIIAVHEWPWDRLRDTLMAGHLLASNQPHNLTDMALNWLGRHADIQHFEDDLERCVKLARNFARTNLPEWKIAKRGLEDMPSAKEKTWKYDSWLPRAVAAEFEYAEDNLFWHVLRDYANADSAVTLALWQVMEQEIEYRGLRRVFDAKMSQLPAAFEMEQRGVTGSCLHASQLKQRLRQESERCKRVCVNIAADIPVQEEWYVAEAKAAGFCVSGGNAVPPFAFADWAEEHDRDDLAARIRALPCHMLELPKSGNNKSLTAFVFDGLRMPTVKRTATGNPSLDKEVLAHWEATLDTSSREYLFVRSLNASRKRDTALNYMATYENFWLTLPGCPEHFVIHPNSNPCGTDTLRWSMNNPNGQQISSQETTCSVCNGEKCEHCNRTGKESLSLRKCFGPLPGREWWSFDAKNIERRLPAYRAEEDEIIRLIEHPDDPPFYGSEHAVAAQFLWPKQFDQCRGSGGELDGRLFKKLHPGLYTRTKGFNFAVQYGCQQRKGDAVAGRAGAWVDYKRRFPKLERLNQSCIAFANRHGFVETFADASVDPHHGYPLLCSRTEDGWVLPTVPLNYTIQGSACWAVGVRWIDMNRRQNCEWRRTEPDFDGWICLQVHDELVNDWPRRGDPVADEKVEKERKLARGWWTKPETRGWCSSNLWRARTVQEQLRQVGNDLSVPLESGCEFHSDNWAEGESLG